MIGLGDYYQRGYDADEAALHATLYPCSSCRAELPGDADWCRHRGLGVCASCANVLEHPECACIGCGTTRDVCDETGFCPAC